MPIEVKEIPVVEDVRGLSTAAYFGIMALDAARQTTLTDCLLSLGQTYSMRCNPEDGSVTFYNNRYSAVFEPDGDTMSVTYTCRDTDYDTFVTISGRFVLTFMTSWDIDDLLELTYE